MMPSNWSASTQSWITPWFDWLAILVSHTGKDTLVLSLPALMGPLVHVLTNLFSILVADTWNWRPKDQQELMSKSLFLSILGLALRCWPSTILVRAEAFVAF